MGTSAAVAAAKPANAVKSSGGFKDPRPVMRGRIKGTLAGDVPAFLRLFCQICIDFFGYCIVVMV